MCENDTKLYAKNNRLESSHATGRRLVTHSKSKFHDSNLDNSDLTEDLGDMERDEIGIVCAICVKVCQLHF